MAQDARKSELIAELAAARRSLSTNVGGLQRDLDVGRRIEETYRRHSTAWLASVGTLGFILARLPARRKAVLQAKTRKTKTEEKVVKAGLLVTVLKIAFDLARPILTKWVTGQVTAYANQRFGSRR